jgi:nucleoid-associated protein YgaU
MLRAITKILTAAICIAAMTASTTQAAPTPTSPILEQKLASGYCPIGLVCPGSTPEVKPAISTPHHRASIPVDGGPPYRVVHRGDTLWGIAKKYLGSGSYWTTLCTFKIVEPWNLHIGETVSFC